MGRKSRAKKERRIGGGQEALARATKADTRVEPFDPGLLEWAYRLTGIEADRVRAAVEKLGGWSLPPVAKEFLGRPSVDTAVATVLLVQGIERLVSHGAEETQLLAKLRRDPYPWPAWAEIRAASIVVNAYSDDAVRVTLEPGRAKGKQPDFRLVVPGAQEGLSVEFKAVGLSDGEADFCRRMSERLPGLVPPVGLMTGHAMDLETPTVRLSAAQLRHAHEEAARLTADIPGFPEGLAGAVIVAHGSEETYIARLQDRLRRALEQLTLDEPSWVAFHWTNGAPIDAVLESIDWTTLPERVAGLMFVGEAVVFPHQDINTFVAMLGRGATSETEMAVQSTLDEEFAATVLDRVEGSAAVRATLLRGRVGPGRSRELLRRDGQQRILPFNLVLSHDPPEFGPRGSRVGPDVEPGHWVEVP